MDVELDIDRALASFAETTEKIISGNPRGLRVTKYRFVPAPKYQPEQIVEIRKHVKLTQEAFAAALNVDRNTVASWETGRKSPVGAALRLLELIEREPSLIAPDPRHIVADFHKQVIEAKAAVRRRRTTRRELSKS